MYTKQHLYMLLGQLTIDGITTIEPTKSIPSL